MSDIMGKKDKRWVLQRKNDFYYKLAKRNKYRSRASYKLLQLNEKFNIIKSGNIVVDLGCAPGGWLQASRDIVGENGFVVGVDLQSVKPLKYENVVAIKGDMTKKEIIEKIIDIMPSKADVVICDASPNISGVWERDHTKSLELSIVALMTATELLKKDGNFVVKVFQGGLFNEYVALLKKYFKKVQTTKPKASRDVSAEVYVVGKRFLGKPFDKNLKSQILTLVDFDTLERKNVRNTLDVESNNRLNADSNMGFDNEELQSKISIPGNTGLMIKSIKHLKKLKSEKRDEKE
jgi:23S rRNA (uridine2552-2'-O)-methyltransferase